MREIYEGNVFSCMGCVDGKSFVHYSYENRSKTYSIESMWEDLSSKFEVKEQQAGNPDYLYMDTPGVKIFDTIHGFIDNYRIIRNLSTNWYRVTLSDDFRIEVTNDHPFETCNRGVVHAEDLIPGEDSMYISCSDMDDLISLEPGKFKEAKVISVEKIEGKVGYSYDVTTETEHFEVNGIYSHNCRSFLSPWKDENGNYKWEGRFNQGRQICLAS